MLLKSEELRIQNERLLKINSELTIYNSELFDELSETNKRVKILERALNLQEFAKS